jgi:hypothetical protein
MTVKNLTLFVHNFKYSVDSYLHLKFTVSYCPILVESVQINGTKDQVSLSFSDSERPVCEWRKDNMISVVLPELEEIHCR